MQCCYDTTYKTKKMLGMSYIVKLLNERSIKGATIALNLLIGSLAHSLSNPPSPLSFPPI